MRPASRRVACRRGKRKVSLARVFLTVAALGGLIMAAYPVLEDVRSQTEAREVIASMTAQTDETHDPKRMDILRQAQHYNAALSHETFAMDNEGLGGSGAGNDDILDLYDRDTEVAVAPYEQQLHWNGYPAMCWIEIPSLGIREPIFHGTTDEVLAQGVGHVEWSSLPVGGSPGNCVLAAHSGMQSKSMFDDLGTLRKGDLFVIHALGDAYQYEVYGKEVVVPREAKDRCTIPDSGDECTLITCTPYGINSHRLLVHARRVAYAQVSGSETLPTIIKRIRPAISKRRLRPIALAAAGIAIPLVASVVSRLGASLVGLRLPAPLLRRRRIRLRRRRASAAEGLSR